jgi:hypothetical protein
MMPTLHSGHIITSSRSSEFEIFALNEPTFIHIVGESSESGLLGPHLLQNFDFCGTVRERFKKIAVR